MASIVLFFFPLDVLDEIWDVIESVSEEFLSYSFYRWCGLHNFPSLRRVFCVLNHKYIK